MSEESVEQRRAGGPASRAGRWRWFALGVMILVCGMTIGSVLTIKVLHRVIRKTYQNPTQIAARASKYITRRLDLTGDQTSQVEGILRERTSALLALHRETAPMVHSELTQLRDEIAAVLDERQAEKWRTQFVRLHHALAQPRLGEDPEHGPTQEK